MKRIASLLLCVVLLAFPIAVNGAQISNFAEASVLYCADNNKAYYSKNENKRMKPASTTKLLTALIALEYAAKDNKRVRFTRDMIAEGSSMYLKVGEVVTLRDLAVGLMLCSGNDAANAVALTIGGSMEKFAAIMNKRAAELGMTHTHFVTPSGLDDENHYTTARDLAVLMTAALKNKAFSELTKKKSETVRFIKPKNKVTAYSNHNRLLSLYDGCIGGKTGYTMSAGRCLVTAARRDGLTLVCVTLNDKRDWQDHIALYDYGFDNLRMNTLDDSELCLDVPTVGGKNALTTVVGEGSTPFVTKASDNAEIERRIVMDNFLYAPIKKNSVAGEVEYFYKGKIIAKHKLTAIEDNNSVKENKSLFDMIKGMLNNAF